MRYHRDEHDILGAVQWTWLEQQLRASDAQLHVIVSGIQVLPYDKILIEKWAQYPAARQRLLRLLRDTCASGVVLLSGDVHYAELSQIDLCAPECASNYSACHASFPLVEATSSGLTHSVGNQAFGLGSWILNTFFRSSYQITGPKGGFSPDLNFGVLEIDWDAQPRTVSVQIRDRTGYVQLEHIVQFPPQTRYDERHR